MPSIRTQFACLLAFCLVLGQAPIRQVHADEKEPSQTTPSENLVGLDRFVASGDVQLSSASVAGVAVAFVSQPDKVQAGFNLNPNTLLLLAQLGIVGVELPVTVMAVASDLALGVTHAIYEGRARQPGDTDADVANRIRPYLAEACGNAERRLGIVEGHLWNLVGGLIVKLAVQLVTGGTDAVLDTMMVAVSGFKTLELLRNATAPVVENVKAIWDNTQAIADLLGGLDQAASKAAAKALRLHESVARLKEKIRNEEASHAERERARAASEEDAIRAADTAKYMAGASAEMKARYEQARLDAEAAAREFERVPPTDANGRKRAFDRVRQAQDRLLTIQREHMQAQIDAEAARVKAERSQREARRASRAAREEQERLDAARAAEREARSRAEAARLEADRLAAEATRLHDELARTLGLFAGGQGTTPDLGNEIRLEVPDGIVVITNPSNPPSVDRGRADLNPPLPPAPPAFGPWAVDDGSRFTYDALTGTLQTVPEPTTAGPSGYARIASTAVTGTWGFDFRFLSTARTAFGVDYISQSTGSATSYAPAPPFYRFTIWTDGTVELNGTGFRPVSRWLVDTNPHTVMITRSSAGLHTWLLDGRRLGAFTESTATTSEFLVVGNTNNGTAVQIRNVTKP